MLICEQLDSSECETFEKLLNVINHLKIDKEIISNTRFQLKKYPNALFDLSQDIINYLQLEQQLIEKDISKYFHLLNLLIHYQEEANLIYTIIEKYLESRSKDNYKEVLYKDSIQLIQLRQEKVFIIQILLLLELQSIVDEQSFEIFLDSIIKKIQMFSQIKFISLRVRSSIILENALNFLDNLKESKNTIKQTSRQSIISKSVITSKQKDSIITINQLGTQIQWLFNELQNNQVSCRELIPNLRFIIKNYVKSVTKNKDDGPKRINKNSSVFDLKNRFSVGSQKARNGLIDLPTLGPMELLLSTQIFPKQKLTDYFDEESLKNCQIITSQIEGLLNEELIENLAGIQLQNIESRSESTISRPTLQQIYKH